MGTEGWNGDELRGKWGLLFGEGQENKFRETGATSKQKRFGRRDVVDVNEAQLRK